MEDERSNLSGTNVISASPAGVIGRLSNLWRYQSISVDDEHVSLVRAAGGRTERLPIAAIDAVNWKRGGLGARIWLETSGGRQFAVGGLQPAQARQLAATVEARADQLGASMEALGRSLHAQLEEWFSATGYLRASQTSALRAAVGTLAGARSQPSGALVQRRLSPDSQSAYSRLQEMLTESGFERARRRANDRFVADQAPRAAALMASRSGFQPAPEQVETIVCDEDVTLVLAGAGTGKTAVITAKVAHLVEQRGVPADSILVLAFNRKAAEEVRERLEQRQHRAEVATFHAFALRILAEQDRAPTISPLAEDERQLLRLIDEILDSLLTDRERGAPLRSFILYNLGEYRAPHEFERPADYFEHLHRIELRTLKGELVKSLEELKIANFLALHGVRYRYEASYPVSTATQGQRQYRPDFYLPEHDLYIEHFGVDRQGEPPPSWTAAEREEYRRGMTWKREIHREHGTELIETYSWQHLEGNWLRSLREQLRERKIELRPQPSRRLIAQLRARMRSSQLSRVLSAFLQHVKSADHSDDELRRRAAESKHPGRAQAFLDLFSEVRHSYDAALGDECDFQDLINRAAALLRDQRRATPYRYILVDEFQDISRGRLKLLASLKRPETAYFLVGDDWQSIYRFAGSEVGLINECEQWLGRIERRTLSQTFRFGSGILDPSSAFVQCNPSQTKRQLRAARRQPDHGITLIWADDTRLGLSQALDDLDARQVRETASLLVLSRYRLRSFTGRAASRRYDQRTIHAAKGSEADYVILLGLEDDRRGFPSQLNDDPLLDLVAPPAEPYEFAEERRLFYVALTRARHGVYLLSDPLHPSPFVIELLNQTGTNLRVLGAAEAGPADPLECPRCRGGRLLSSEAGQSLRCSLAPQCDYLAPACPCGSGYQLIDSEFNARCTNRACQTPAQRCPSCYAGVLVERNGPYGPFWACSRFVADPPCGYTRDRRAAPRRSSPPPPSRRSARGP